MANDVILTLLLARLHQWTLDIYLQENINNEVTLMDSTQPSFQQLILKV